MFLKIKFIFLCFFSVVQLLVPLLHVGQIHTDFIISKMIMTTLCYYLCYLTGFMVLLQKHTWIQLLRFDSSSLHCFQYLVYPSWISIIVILSYSLMQSTVVSLSHTHTHTSQMFDSSSFHSFQYFFYPRRIAHPSCSFLFIDAISSIKDFT